MKHVFPELVPKDKEDTFRNYKYEGVDNSITYQYFLSPLCDYAVNNWIPPNVAFSNQSQHRTFTRSPSSASP